MLPYLTTAGAVKRRGHDDGYHGRPRNPPFRLEALLDAYLAGYRIGRDQRLLEVQDGTHYSLFEPKKESAA